jgi:ABC-type transport system involved in multi-copper enzyme maturation permease subunit
MVGSVFHQEMLLGGRRGRHHLLRWLFAGWLIVQFLVLYLIYRVEVAEATNPRPWGRGGYDRNVTGRFVVSYLDTLVTQQLIVLLLATPAFAAGAITDEKTSGTLQYLLTTGLQTREIIWGKLLGRLVQVALLSLAGLPFVWFFGGFAGLDPGLLLLVLAVTVPPAVACAAASLLASVWCRRTRDAVLRLYAAGAAALVFAWGLHEVLLTATAPAGSPPGLVLGLLGSLDEGLNYFNPFYVLDPLWAGEGSRVVVGRLLGSVAAWGGVAASCLALAVRRLRPAYIRQLESQGKTKKPRWYRADRPVVADEPLRWKERYIEGMAFLPVLRQVPRRLGIAVIFLGTFVVGLTILLAHLPSQYTVMGLLHLVWTLDGTGLATALLDLGDASNEFQFLGLGVFLLASLIAGIRCSGAVSGERERQTWEALLLTPVETRELIRGKLWGILGAMSPYLLAYAAAAVPLAVLAGGWPLFWVVLWWALTWLAMYFVGAAGIWCSVRSKSSWRSLLGTVSISYVGGFFLSVVSLPVIGIVAGLVVVGLLLLDRVFLTSLGSQLLSGGALFFIGFAVASYLVLAGAFFGVARYFLADAQKWVADRERTRHWKDEYHFRRPRRRTQRARPRP